MPGRHTARRKPPSRHARRGAMRPLTSAVLATVILAGGAYGVTRMGSAPGEAATLSGDRAAGHVSRDLQRPLPSVPAVSPSAVPATPTPSATSVPSAPPSPSPSPTRAVKPSPTRAATVVSTGSCQASFYDEPQATASGETFDPTAMTAAHKSLKFNTRVRVTNRANGKSVVVRINDRGPYVAGRCLDLSRAAFVLIASASAGYAEVTYEVLG